MLIPYYSLKDLSKGMGYPDRNLPLRSVTIGPNPNKTLNLASLRMLLNRLGYPNVPVTASNTPYRG